MNAYAPFVVDGKISREYAGNQFNNLVVLFDREGRLVDMFRPSVNEIYLNCYSHIGLRLKEAASIYDLFEKEPAEPEISPVSEGRRDYDLLPNRPGSLNFLHEQEEFHSVIPLVYLRPCEVDDDLRIGFIRLSSFMMRLVGETNRHTLFCADDQGTILGYNKRFLKLAGKKEATPGALLNRPIGDYLTRTPEKIHQEILNNIPIPAPDALTPLLDVDFSGRIQEGVRLPEGAVSTEQGLVWHSMGQNPFFVLKEKLAWNALDFRLELEITDEGTTSLPCLIFGDPLKPDSDYFPDQEGYLLGPLSGNDGLTLKRAGEAIHRLWSGPTPLSGGCYRFSKTNNIFTVQKEGRTLFSYADSDPLERTEPGSLLLYLRQPRRCVLRRLSLGMRDSRPLPGRYDYFTSPRSAPDRHFLLTSMDSRSGPSHEWGRTIYRLQEMTALRAQLDGLQRAYEASLEREQAVSLELSRYREGESAFVASGKTMTLLLEKAERLAAADATLLLYGETGTGKEVLARHIHAKSPFAQGPFVKVDCSTLPATLMESLLFGHEKGAFTGADGVRKGLFETARDGTLFLDEIGNISLDLQAKLLRFLQDFTILPVGGTKPMKLNLRLITAANVSLEQLIARKLFREDLYYRIAVAILHLPPLRERTFDIPLLVRYFLDMLNLKYHKRVSGVSPAALGRLERHSWPGNVRELRNVMERAFLYCDGEVISEELLLFPEKGGGLPAVSERKSTKAHQALDCDKKTILVLFRKHQGMVGKMAEELNVSRQTLYNFFSRHGIRPNELRINPHREKHPRKINPSG